MLTGFVAGIVVLTGLIVAGFGVFIYGRRQFRQFVIANLYSPDGDHPSQFAIIVQQIAVVFGAEVASNLKAVFMGVQSVEAKNERRQASQAIIDNNTILGAIAGSFPAVAKKMKNNPMFAEIASMAVNKAMESKSGAPAPGNNGHAKPIEFKF